MRKIHVISRSDTKNLLASRLVREVYDCGNAPWAMIGIFSPGDRPVIRDLEEYEQMKTDGCAGMLFLCFNDVELGDRKEWPRDKETLEMYRPFTERHAKRVQLFFERMKNEVDTLIVHCDAGISRSGAIGLWVVRRLGLDEKAFMERHPDLCPNDDVLRLLCAPGPVLKALGEIPVIYE